MIETLDLIGFTDKLKMIAKKAEEDRENRVGVLALSLIAEKQKIKLPEALKHEPFYLISKNDDKFLANSFRVYAKDDNTLAVCNCFNMPVSDISIDSLIIGCYYQLQSYAKCSFAELTMLIPLFHSAPGHIDFGDNQYAEVLPDSIPDGFIKGIRRLYYVHESILPVNRVFSILGILKENHQILLRCLSDKCYWLVYLDNLTEYMQKKDQIKSFVRVKTKRPGRFTIIYQ